MNPSLAPTAAFEPCARRAGFVVSGDWRSYYFGFYFADKGAPGE